MYAAKNVLVVTGLCLGILWHSAYAELPRAHTPRTVTPPVQTICKDDTWKRADRQYTRTMFYRTALASQPAHVAWARVDTGSDMTLVADCMLQQLRAKGAAYPTGKNVTARIVHGHRVTLREWMVVLGVGPYRIRMPVLGHHNNIVEVLIGEDLLQQIDVGLMVTDRGTVLTFP